MSTLTLQQTVSPQCRGLRTSPSFKGPDLILPLYSIFANETVPINKYAIFIDNIHGKCEDLKIIIIMIVEAFMMSFTIYKGL